MTAIERVVSYTCVDKDVQKSSYSSSYSRNQKSLNLCVENTKKTPPKWWICVCSPAPVHKHRGSIFHGLVVCVCARARTRVIVKDRLNTYIIRIVCVCVCVCVCVTLCVIPRNCEIPTI